MKQIAILSFNWCGSSWTSYLKPTPRKKLSNFMQKLSCTKM